MLISHNHYDHLDIPTLKRLASEHDPRFIVPLRNEGLLRKNGITSVAEMDWWDELEVAGPLRLTCVPAQHHSGRGMRDRHKTLWAGFVLRGGAGTVYFSGDTGAGAHFSQVKERFGEITLALLPIGAYRPRWFMKTNHMTPAEAVEAHRLLQPRASVAFHFGTFPLGDDGEIEPVEEPIIALAEQGVPEDAFWVLGHGEGRVLD